MPEGVGVRVPSPARYGAWADFQPMLRVVLSHDVCPDYFPDCQYIMEKCINYVLFYLSLILSAGQAWLEIFCNFTYNLDFKYLKI